MIQSVRQRKKKQKNMLGMIGIISILGLGGFGFYFFDSNSNPLDEYNCSIKNGPNAVTAIIFDKSQKYSTEQVTDIKTSFNLWLAGKEPITKNRRVALDFFEEGNRAPAVATRRWTAWRRQKPVFISSDGQCHSYRA